MIFVGVSAEDSRVSVRCASSASDLHWYSSLGIAYRKKRLGKDRKGPARDTKVLLIVFIAERVYKVKWICLEDKDLGYPYDVKLLLSNED